MNQFEKKDNPPGIVRRLAAIVYDSFLVLALMLIVTAFVLAVRQGAALPTNTSWFSVLIALVPYGFFSWFWTHGGQTLGMRAWRIAISGETPDRLTFREANLRFVLALFSYGILGVGFLWQLIDAEKRTVHGRLSKTRLRLNNKA